MSESSRSKPDEYDSTTDYHYLKFENRCLRGSGDDFQKLFEDIMVRAKPGEFERVRPYGRFGDRKCDGLIESEGIIFQVYSPDELKQAEVQKKIDEDLEGAVQHWSDTLKKWVFVYNAKRGTSSDIQLTLQQKQKQYPDIEIDSWSNDYLWEITRELSLQQRSEILGLSPSSIAKTEQTLALWVNDQEHKANWRETCRELLNHWKGLTTNALTKPNGVRFQLDEIFVPLGVVERREKPKHRSNDGSPAEQGSELYEEKLTPISQNDFFEQVLRQKQSKHSRGSRIAIIGEPGAGKTTQLQKIGDWILKETDGIPIWIPLAGVGTRKLKDYLLNDWLQTAIEELEVSQAHRDDLGQLLKTGKVWMLLDGVDEMAISDALKEIATQMREGWLRNVRVVLTCRLNVWDAGKNALDGFDVYRNLDFDYPTEVHQFIDKWFVTEPELQSRLKMALEQSGKERIRDMVKNLLRLTLLCYSWQLRQGKLPETKAGLYEWFVDAFYEWNKGKVPTKLNATIRKELNAALGELAKEAIDQISSRFRLRENFINQFLGDADDEDSLFYLALQLGWLNRIGVAEENPLEDVYVFFHPTFQEYFAALAIDNRLFFLDHVSHNPHEGFYRIFEPDWQGTILFWLGRSGQEISSDQKILFINELYYFDDGCKNVFFSTQALILAALSINEFFEHDLASNIISSMLELKTGYFDDEQQQWLGFPELFVEQVDAALTGMNEAILQEEISIALTEVYELEINDISLVKIIELFDLLSKTQNGELQTIKEIIRFLEKYSSPKEVLRLISKCERIIPLDEVSQYDSLRLYLSYIFHELSKPLNRIIDSSFKFELENRLKSLNENIDCQEVKLFIDLTLFKLSATAKTACRIIKPLIREADIGKYLFALRISNSLKIDLDQELDLLIELFKRLNYQTDFLQKQIIISITNFLKNENILTILESVLDKNDFLPDRNIINIAYRLAKKNPTHSVAIAKLIYALDSPDQSIEHEARTLLCEVSSHNLEVVSIFSRHMQKAKFPETIGIALNILSIDSQNEEALTELTMSLGMLDFLYHDDLTDKAFVETAVPIACYLLKGKVFEFRPMQIVIQYLIKAFNVDSKSTKSLSSSDTQFNTVVFWYCCRTLEHCTQNMSYPDFYRTWHSSSSANSALPMSD